MPEATSHFQPPLGETFSAAYYASHCGRLVYGRQERHWARFFGGIGEQIVQTLRPRRVFDAGCAHGFLLEALHDRGVEVRGRDISSFAVSEVRSDLRQRVELGSIADRIEGDYDLVTCIEVLEHMTEAEAVWAIASMAAAAPMLLFSSSPSDFEEATHINVRPVIWWLERLAEAGLLPVASYDASFVTAHAFLLERTTRAPRAGELSAFATLIGQRIAASERETPPDWARSRFARPVAWVVSLMPTSGRRHLRRLLHAAWSQALGFAARLGGSSEPPRQDSATAPPNETSVAAPDAYGAGTTR